MKTPLCAGVVGVLAALAAPAAATAIPATAKGSNKTLPTVDLGYAVHRPTLNTAGDFYNFTNIRYAAPPVGELRFAKPVAPQTVDRTVTEGGRPLICQQGYPDWLLQQAADEAGVSLDVAKLLAYSNTQQTEDCLLLDVMVPTKTFDDGAKDGAELAPVLVWIHGGGYTIGSKTAWGNPAGLIARSGLGDEKGVVFVEINYRLGMFGWLAGGPDVTANVGLYDQRFALDWIQENIHLFGGDKAKVTIMGESAGGGSVMHQITAYGGSEGPVPFQRAIPQSPAWMPTTDTEGSWEAVLASASKLSARKITTLAELRSLSAATLIQVNRDVIGASGFGTFTYTPTVDGVFTPDIVPQLLANGRYDDSVSIVAGHNLNESITFLPELNSSAEFDKHVSATLFGVPAAQLDYITTELYPDELDGRHGYYTQFGRAAQLVSEAFFTCNTRYLMKAAAAAGKESFGYRFQVPPGTHGQDVAYTFYSGGDGVDADLAHAMQDYFVAFAQKGDLSQAAGLPAWQAYGDEGTLTTFGTDGVGSMVDETKNERCDYWGSGRWSGSGDSE